MRFENSKRFDQLKLYCKALWFWVSLKCGWNEGWDWVAFWFEWRITLRAHLTSESFKEKALKGDLSMYDKDKRSVMNHGLRINKSCCHLMVSSSWVDSFRKRIWIWGWSMVSWLYLCWTSSNDKDECWKSFFQKPIILRKFMFPTESLLRSKNRKRWKQCKSFLIPYWSLRLA